MNRERLALLAARLESIPPKHFNLKSWVETNGHPLGKAVRSPGVCGTTACAAGWACTMPEFKELGLEFCKDGSYAPKYKARTGGEALMAFFDINNYEMNNLFSPLDYPQNELTNPQAVCNRIYSMLAE